MHITGVQRSTKLVPCHANTHTANIDAVPGGLCHRNRKSVRVTQLFSSLLSV